MIDWSPRSSGSRCLYPPPGSGGPKPLSVEETNRSSMNGWRYFTHACHILSPRLNRSKIDPGPHQAVGLHAAIKPLLSPCVWCVGCAGCVAPGCVVHVC
eukprot:2882041-Pyramimonas_sp.AAC.1